jgi:hypothetical protein
LRFNHSCDIESIRVYMSRSESPCCDKQTAKSFSTGCESSVPVARAKKKDLITTKQR